MMTSISTSSTSSTTLSAAPAPVGFHLSDYENMHTAVLRMSELEPEVAHLWAGLAGLLERQLQYERHLFAK
jgi:hypothetical protein